MMEPPLKLFGRTIYGTPSASSHDDAAEGTTSTGAREDPPSPQDAHESGAESGAKSEVTLSGGAPASCFPELSSSGSNGAEEEKNSSSPGEGDGTPPPSQSSGGPMTEENEGLDGEDLGSGADGTTSQEVSGDDAGEKGQKTLRRPDKAVACPRCNSLETKFCYYNNYNVKQPRHFCKNCQRYWTAGGTLRNVPVGAGRRKNKHGNVISPRQATDMRLVRGDEPDIAAPMLVGKGVTMPVSVAVPVVQTVMGAPIAGSTKPVIRVTGGNSDGGSTIPYAMRVPSLEATYILTPSEPLKPGEAAVIGGNLPRLATPGFEDSTAGSSEVVDGSRGWRGWRPKEETTSGSGGSSSVHDVKNESRVSPEFNKDGSTSVTWGGSGEVQTSPSATGPFGFFNGAWPYGYNIGWSGGAFCAGGVTGNGNPMPAPPAGVTACTAWSGTAAGNMWTGIPWGLPEVAWGPGWGTPWSIGPWAMGAAAPGAPVAMSPAISATTPNGIHTPVPCASATSGTNLGKHPRTSDGAAAGEGAVWAPKSLRIADSDEAMRSSVWRILGVGSRPDITTSSTFRAFQPKMESKKVTDDDQQTQQASLQANPAAMSRSLYFQESN